MTDLAAALLALVGQPGSTVATSAAPTTGGLPEFVKRMQEQRGDRDPDTGLTQQVRTRRCAQCRRAVLAALDPSGLSRYLDTKPLTDGGELLAQLAGRTTYSLHTRDIDPAYLIITERSVTFRSTLRPGDQVDVIVEHDCRIDIDTLPHMASIFDRRKYQPDPINPPF